MSDNVLPVLIVVGVGGIAIYLLSRPAPIVTPPPVVAPTQQCGASYVGVGVSVPCQLIAQGVKALGNEAYTQLKKAGVTQQVSIAASGIKPWEYAITPVAISHAAYNETLGRIF